MNAQQIYDTVVRHLAKQGRRSMYMIQNAFNGKTVPACAYRGAGGMSCAVGCLIPDSEYSKVFENISVDQMKRYLTREEPETDVHRARGVLAHLRSCPTLCALLREHFLLLSALQRAHDMNPTASGHLTIRLRSIAREFELSDKVVSDQSWPDRWE